MDQYDFYKALKEHCQKTQDCENCCMRLFCHTPPCDVTDRMMKSVIIFLMPDYNCMDSPTCLDRYKEAFEQPCPLSLDMTNALGYEPHQ